MDIILGYFSVKFVLIIMCIFFYASDSSNIFRSYFSTINILVSGMNMKSGFIIRFFFRQILFQTHYYNLDVIFEKKKTVNYAQWIHSFRYTT